MEVKDSVKEDDFILNYGYRINRNNFLLKNIQYGKFLFRNAESLKL